MKKRVAEKKNLKLAKELVEILRKSDVGFSLILCKKSKTKKDFYHLSNLNLKVLREKMIEALVVIEEKKGFDFEQIQEN